MSRKPRVESIRFTEINFYEAHEGRWHLLMDNGERQPGPGVPLVGGMYARARPDGTRICVTERVHTKIVKKKKGAGSKFPDDPHGILESKP